MEDELIRLLERIEKAGLRTGIGKIQLKEELKQSDAPIAPDVSEKLIKDAHKSGLIKDAKGQSKPEDSSDRDDMVCVLTIKGFELLNQIWIKKAIAKFNESSDKSYDKIIDLTGKLGLSVEMLYKSSEWLGHLTRVLIVLTFFLAGLTISDFYLKHPSIETSLFIIFVLIAGICAAFADKIYALLQKR